MKKKKHSFDGKFPFDSNLHAITATEVATFHLPNPIPAGAAKVHNNLIVSCWNSNRRSGISLLFFCFKLGSPLAPGRRILLPRSLSTTAPPRPLPTSRCWRSCHQFYQHCIRRCCTHHSLPGLNSRIVFECMKHSNGNMQ